MITLLTGQPGHGKTLRAIQLALELRGQGREVYAVRVTGLDQEKTGFHALEKMADWQSLPDGSVVLVDECYEDIPARGPSKPIPEWVQKLATHRHRGFDFILICQLGTQIDAFVRGLVDKHVHVRRKFGFAKSVLLEWDRYVGNPSSNSELKSARKKAWSYPTKVFELYRSATMHTVKKSMPWQFIGIPVLLCVVVGLIWFVFHRFSERGEQRHPVGAPAGDKGALAPPSRPAQPAEVKKPLSVEEFAQKFTPRIASKPWSAPAFDERQVKSDPELYCIATEKLRCLCHTEQGTRYSIAARECLMIVKNGNYNPFKAPLHRALNTDYEAERPTSRNGAASAVPAKNTRSDFEPLPTIVPRVTPKLPTQQFPALR